MIPPACPGVGIWPVLARVQYDTILITRGLTTIQLRLRSSGKAECLAREHNCTSTVQYGLNFSSAATTGTGRQKRS